MTLKVSLIGYPPSRLLIEGSDENFNPVVGGYPGSRTLQGLTYPVEPLIYFDIQERGYGDSVDSRTMTHFTEVFGYDLEAVRIIEGIEKPKVVSPEWDHLRAYQKVAAYYLLRRGRGILGDDRGLGKTAVAIAAIQVSKVKRTLVLVPGYLTKQWEEEFNRWSPIHPVVVPQTTPAERLRILREFKEGVLIAGYEVFWRRPYRDYFLGGWDTIICDEAQRLKGRDSQRTKGLRLLRSTNLYLLTGSYVQNSPDEAWSLLNLIDHSRFSSYWAFVNRFCQVNTVWAGGQEFLKVGALKDLEGFREVVAPRIIRRTKEQVLPELPPKIYKTIKVDLLPAELKFYKKVENDLILEVGNSHSIVLASGLRRMQILRQSLLDPLQFGGPALWTKLWTVKELVMDLISTGEKVCVFGWHTAPLYKLSELLLGERIATSVITGDIKPEDRAASTEKFRDGRTQVLIGSIAACTDGYNWDHATTAVFLEKWWVPSVNQSTEDRIHRMTTKVPKVIYSIIARNTVDEDLESTLRLKEAVTNEVQGIKITYDQLLKRRGNQG